MTLANDRLKVAIQALNEIVNPVQFMRIRADASGDKIGGHMANYLANDPHYLREIARKALSRVTGAVGQPSKP